MIRTESIDMSKYILDAETSREVDPYTDSESVRLVAANLEMAAQNLITAGINPDCLVLTAETCTHRLIATSTSEGDIRVAVIE